jgi:hypothetical protein
MVGGPQLVASDGKFFTTPEGSAGALFSAAQLNT